MWLPTPTFLYRNYLYRRIVNKLPKEGYFLDVGTGNGDFLISLSKMGFRGESIDPSRDAVSIAQKKVQGNKNISVKLGNIFTYKPDRKYNVIFSFETLEHIKEDQKAMTKIFELLKPGGIFVMSVPAHMSEWSPIDEIKGHYRRYEKNELSNKLKKAGFDITSFYSFGFPFLYLVRKMSSGGKYIRTKTMKAGKDEKGRESSIQLEYEPKYRFIATNKYLLYPLFWIMDMFIKTDLGFGYIVVCRKNK